MRIKIETFWVIVMSDREEALKHGCTHPKLDDGYIQTLCIIVDDNPECSLVQLKMKMEVEVPGVRIRRSTIDLLLDGHVYTRRKSDGRTNEM